MASFLPHPTHAVLKPTVAHALFMDATHDNDPGHIQVHWVGGTLHVYKLMLQDYCTLAVTCSYMYMCTCMSICRYTLLHVFKSSPCVINTVFSPPPLFSLYSNRAATQCV